MLNILQSKENNVNEAKHADIGKLGLQYILAMPGLNSIAAVGDFGAKKYGQWNFKPGMPWMKLLGSCARHLVAFIGGEDLDQCKSQCIILPNGLCERMEHSNLPHLAHLAYDALMLLDYMENKREFDDRYKRHIEVDHTCPGLQCSTCIPF